MEVTIEFGGNTLVGYIPWNSASDEPIAPEGLCGPINAESMSDSEVVEMTPALAPILLGALTSTVTTHDNCKSKEQRFKRTKEHCRDYLINQYCDRKNCMFYHPVCRDFLNGICTRENCQYPHFSDVSRTVQCENCLRFGHGASSCQYLTPPTHNVPKSPF